MEERDSVIVLQLEDPEGSALRFEWETAEGNTLFLRRLQVWEGSGGQWNDGAEDENVVMVGMVYSTLY